MATAISIPAEESFRNHIRIVLSYMLIHFSLIELGEFPALGLEEVLDLKVTTKFFEKLNGYPEGKPMKITFTEALMIYSAHVCMNKLLVSKYDEIITPAILEQLPQDHPLKTFKGFRNEMLNINGHWIRNTEKSLADKKLLHHLRNKLVEIVID